MAATARRISGSEALVLWGDWVASYRDVGSNGEPQEGGRSKSPLTPLERLASDRQRIDYNNPIGKRVDGIVQRMDSPQRFIVTQLFVERWQKQVIADALEINRVKLDKLLYGVECFIEGALV